MSRLAIRITNAVKSFKRFNHPGWRALDALGVPISSKRFDVFSALRGLSIDIEKGERVALIGRNGAGKSTLLRVISGQMRPDAGSVQVNGTVQALMELGTGFHPEFSGLDNIRSSLAYQGLNREKVESLVEEIIDFTELEDFISRPVREYSAGMYARLAFAVSTTITPDILIIDEILGAGDAYFMGKSIQRMRQLTTQGATILFVSHDMSAVQLLCERGVWIEKGAIRADGDVLSVSKAYLASVREDEELRARARSMQLTKRQLLEQAGRNDLMLLRFIGADHSAPTTPFTISQIIYGNGKRGGNNVALDDSTCISRAIIEPGVTNWSGLKTVDDRDIREFKDFGGKFIHAPLQIDWSGLGDGDRWLEIEYLPSQSSVALEIYDMAEREYKPLFEFAAVTEATRSWEKARILLPTEGLEVSTRSDEIIGDIVDQDLQELSSVDRYGEGHIKIVGFGFFDSDSERRHTLISGDRAHAILAYESNKSILDPVAVVAIYRPDGSCAMQVVSNMDGMRLGGIDWPWSDPRRF